ncbi:MAG TPA: pyridoxamine 5'-phosphate oxidase [Gaiellaceae bacterium]
MRAQDPRAGTLRKSDLSADPFEQFAAWLADAEAAGIELPEATTLATATRDGKPSARMVLLKEHGPEGFVFFSGYESRKGRELEENPRAALVFYWHELGRQVRVEGTVERLAREESEAYFRTRPPGSRLGAWASPQSEVVPSRETLDALYDKAAAAYGDGEVPLPESWGGYRLRAQSIELWQHRPDRLHDRLRYRLDDEVWVVERLAP